MADEKNVPFMLGKTNFELKPMSKQDFEDYVTSLIVTGSVPKAIQATLKKVAVDKAAMNDWLKGKNEKRKPNVGLLATPKLQSLFSVYAGVSVKDGEDYAPRFNYSFDESSATITISCADDNHATEYQFKLNEADPELFFEYMRKKSEGSPFVATKETALKLLNDSDKKAFQEFFTKYYQALTLIRDAVEKTVGIDDSDFL